MEGKYITVIIILLFNSCTREPEGTRFTYYKDGTIRTINHFDNNIQQGPSYIFYENGNIKQVEHFKDGSKNGMAYYFYRSGSLAQFRHWRNGLMNGYVADYYNDSMGMVMNVLLFNDSGQVQYKKTFDDHGFFIRDSGNKSSGLNQK